MKRILRLLTKYPVLVVIGLVVVGIMIRLVLELRTDEPNLTLLNVLSLLVAALLAGLSAAAGRLAQTRPKSPVQSLLEWTGGLSHEFAGAFILGLLFLFLVTLPQEKKEDMALRTSLINELGSHDNGIALRAAEQLRSHNWLDAEDCYLEGAFLNNADLRGADLHGACLKGVFLEGADLSGTNLSGANLSGASLREATLVGTVLDTANLTGADLSRANLTDARLYDATVSSANLKQAVLVNSDLTNANLEKADLRESTVQQVHLDDATLKGANLYRVQGLDTCLFDTATLLPSGEYWNEQIDVNKFTE